MKNKDKDDIKEAINAIDMVRDVLGQSHLIWIREVNAIDNGLESYQDRLKELIE